MVSSHRPAGFAGGAALLPVYGGDFLSSHSAPRWETRKTSRGRREVGRRRHVGMRGNPHGFLSSTGRCAPGLLSFRYTVGIFQVVTRRHAGRLGRQDAADVKSAAAPRVLTCMGGNPTAF